MKRKDPYKSYELMRKTLSYIADRSYVDFIDHQWKINSDKPGSISGHHSFKGGWWVHTQEVIENSILLSNKLYPKEEVSQKEIVISSLIHDLDKLLCRYKKDTEEPSAKQVAYAKSLGIKGVENYSKSTLSMLIDKKLSGKEIDYDSIHGYVYDNSRPPMNDDGIVALLCYQNGLPVNENIISAVCLHHSGWSTLIAGSKRNVDMTPLATIVACSDLMSGFYQNGIEER